METKPKYINLLTDFGFKRIFGTEANVDLLIDFLNAVLDLPSPIVKVNFYNAEQQGNVEAGRKAIYDVFCTAENKEEFIIEMQKGRLTYFRDRALFYTTFPIQSQAPKGDWNFRLNPVFYIALLDFFYEPEEHAKLERIVMLKDQYNQVFYKKLHFYYFQLPAFTLKEYELKTRKDQWIFFLKNIENLDENIVQLFQNDKIFSKMINSAEISKLSHRDYQQYVLSQFTFDEYQDSISEAKRAERAKVKKELLEGKKKLEEMFKQNEEIHLKIEEAQKQKEEAQKQKEEAQSKANEMTLLLIKSLHLNGKNPKEISELTNTSIEKVQEVLRVL